MTHICKLSKNIEKCPSQIFRAQGDVFYLFSAPQSEYIKFAIIENQNIITYKNVEQVNWACCLKNDLN